MRRPYPTKLTPYGPGSGVLLHRRGHLFVTPELYRNTALMSRNYPDIIKILWVRA
jgi:hypothetical protein